METFDQAGPHLGCMSCHNSARMRADFMWTILDHAYPAQFGPATPGRRGLPGGPAGGPAEAGHSDAATRALNTP
jgi:hypothetical protein